MYVDVLLLDINSFAIYWHVVEDRDKKSNHEFLSSGCQGSLNLTELSLQSKTISIGCWHFRSAATVIEV